MAGVYRTSKVPILQSEGQEAVDNKAKADLLNIKTFKTVHSSENIRPASKKKREEKLKNENFKLEYNNDNTNVVNTFFSLQELKQAVQKG